MNAGDVFLDCFLFLSSVVAVVFIRFLHWHTKLLIQEFEKMNKGKKTDLSFQNFLSLYHRK